MTHKPAFVRQWTVANFAAMFVGYILYTPIGHGITGGHDRELSVNQLIAHCVALGLVGSLVGLAQRRVLSRYLTVPTWRIFATAVGFIALFWVGYYQNVVNGPDTDILLGYLALGCFTWIGIVPTQGHYGAIALAVLAFPIASFVGELILFAIVIAAGMRPNFSQDHLAHLAFWLTIGSVTGILGGYLSAVGLKRAGVTD